jgi:hypothetical protein
MKVFINNFSKKLNKYYFKTIIISIRFFERKIKVN